MKLKHTENILLAGGIFGALLIAEIIIRCFGLAPIMLDCNIIYNLHFDENPRICYRIKSHANKDINLEGFRDDEFLLRKDKNLVRIIMLGDSITFGALVSRRESFSDELEKMLSVKSEFLSSPKKFEVMNFGVGGII